MNENIEWQCMHLKLNWKNKNEIEIGDEDIKNLLMNMMLRKIKKIIKKYIYEKTLFHPSLLGMG